MEDSMIVLKQQDLQPKSRLIGRLKNNDNVNFNKQLFSEYSQTSYKQIQEMMSQIKQWRLRYIGIRLQQDSIMKSMIGINFCNLKNLSISEGKMSSIEGLHKLQLPSIQYLYFINSQISNLRDLTKTKLPSLKLLCFQNSKVIEQGQLYKMFLNKQQKFYIFSLDEYEKRVTLNHIGWIVKLQFKQVEYLFLRERERIDEGKVKECLSRRFTDINIFYEG